MGGGERMFRRFFLFFFFSFYFFCQKKYFLENSLFPIHLQVLNYLRLRKSNWFSNKSPGALSVICSISCIQAIHLILFYKSHF